MPQHYDHECAKGGPARLPITWDRALGGGRVSCPLCGVNRLTATIRGHTI